jgi:cytochrome c oxidase assembly protein subunit 15
LLLGMGVGQWIFWLALDLGEPRVSALRLPLPQRLFAWGFLHLLTLQVLYGAFMAGTHAGVLYSTFPDMNGRYSPVPFFVTGSVIGDLLQSPMAIHYVHRALALLVLAYAAVLALFLRGHAHVAGVLGVLLATLGLQLVLGALTAIWHVPVAWAVAHQVGAYLLVTAVVALCHKISGVTEALDAG